jgi:hypothetical protein
MGSEKKRGKVAEENQTIDERMGGKGWTNILKTLSASDDRKTSDSVRLLGFVQPFSKLVFHSGTFTVVTTHTSSNPAFLQGLIQTDAVCFRIRSKLVWVNSIRSPCSAAFNMTMRLLARGTTDQLLHTEGFHYHDY